MIGDVALVRGIVGCRGELRAALKAENAVAAFGWSLVELALIGRLERRWRGVIEARVVFDCGRRGFVVARRVRVGAPVVIGCDDEEPEVA